MKKIRRLILHIGTIKTGTTTIQESLGNAREAMLAHKIHYPGIRPYSHIFTFPPIFVPDPQVIDWFRQQLLPSEDVETKVQGYRRAWISEFKASASDRDFIISAEHLVSPFFDEGAVQRLQGFIEQYFEEVTVIAYIRHYNSWIPSEAQQVIRNGFNAAAGVGEIVRKLQNLPSRLSYRGCLQKWVDAFGRAAVVVRPFDPTALHNHSLLADFFRACSLPADEFSIPEIRSNGSIGWHAAAFLQKYNQTYPVLINRSINPERGLARQGLPIHLYRNLADEKFKPALVYTPAQAERFNEEIDYVNQFFADGYRFQHVSSGDGETQTPSADDIPVQFFVELINNYNKQIDSYNKQIDGLRTQNAHAQQILDLLKIPFFLRVLNRLPLLKALLQKITRRRKV